ncbi:MAG: large conductance mechanosensitive channel protein MscL [Gaiellaceae bacterium]
MGKIVEEFREFLMQGNLVTLAVAFVIGGAFAALLTSFVGDIITPVIGAVFGKTDFSNLTLTIHGSLFKYGSFITALITFVSIAVAVFFFIVKPYDRFAKKPEEDAGPSDEERRHQELLAALRARG